MSRVITKKETAAKAAAKSKKEPRTDAEKVAMWPLKITLCGGEVFAIPQPKIGAMMNWAEKWYDTIGRFMDIANDAEQAKKRNDQVKTIKMASAVVDKRVDLFFEFCAGALDKERVMEESDTEEFLAAVTEVLAAASPLAFRLLR